MSQTGKIAEVLFENALETHEEQIQLLGLVDVFKPNEADMQNAGNVVWRPVQQHAPIIDGWDITGQETDIIEETYPAVLGTPKNDFVKQRADDLRDMQFWERRGKESGMKQASILNANIASLIANTGSLFYRISTGSGYEFVSQAQALMNERQTKKGMRHFCLNDRDTLAFSADLAGRQTLQGRPEQTWRTGQIGQNVAEFDVHTGSFLPNLAGGADPGATIAADYSGAPEGGSIDAVTKIVTNVDYRVSGDIQLSAAAAAAFNIGDRITVSGVNAIGLTDKTNTNQLMTFTIVAKDDVADTIQVFPKPIAQNDPGLTALQKAYANVDNQILNGATVTRLNIDASAKTNIFWDYDSVEVTSGDAPIELLNEFGGMKVISETMSNGQKMYMAYDGNINDMTFQCRLFTWYEVTNKNPSANGVAIRG